MREREELQVNAPVKLLLSGIDSFAFCPVSHDDAAELRRKLIATCERALIHYLALALIPACRGLVCN
jgi:hypothetical protein